MFRFMGLIASLLGFFAAQASQPNFGANIQFAAPKEKVFAKACETHHSSSKSEQPISLGDKEEPNTPDFLDDLLLNTQAKFEIAFLYEKVSWVTFHFIPWVLSADFERPPKLSKSVSLFAFHI